MSAPPDDDPVTLQKIWNQMVALNSRMNAGFARVDTRLDGMAGRLDVHGAGIEQLIGDVSKLNSRFDNLLVGTHGKEHEELRERVEKLEKGVGRR